MLNDLLTTDAFAFGLVFARMGSTVMLLPGFAESYVSPRIRLMFALALSLVVTPVVSIHLPPMPPSMVGAAVLVGGEVIIGVFMGGAGAHVDVGAACCRRHHRFSGQSVQRDVL